MSKPTQRQLLEGITEVVTTIADNMATKQDIQDIRGEMATGLAEVRSEMATKDDLKRFATKDDLELMGRRLESKMRVSRAVSTRHHLETRAMIGDLNRRLA